MMYVYLIGIQKVQSSIAFIDIIGRVEHRVMICSEYAQIMLTFERVAPIHLEGVNECRNFFMDTRNQCDLINVTIRYYWPPFDQLLDSSSKRFTLHSYT